MFQMFNFKLICLYYNRLEERINTGQELVTNLILGKILVTKQNL